MEETRDTPYRRRFVHCYSIANITCAHPNKTEGAKLAGSLGHHGPVLREYTHRGMTADKTHEAPLSVGKLPLSSDTH